MTSECLPFRQIPRTTQLFLDYLDFTPEIRPFYGRSPRFLDWAREEASRIAYPAERRSRVASILERQNRGWGASEKTLAQIDRFRRGALAVVTGQQVGLFGGPVFSLFKALSTIRLAEEAGKLGIDAIPIFWLATEDHDFQEVDRVRIPGPEGSLETLASGAQPKPDVPVGTIPLRPQITEVVRTAVSLLAQAELGELLENAYQPGLSLGTGFARLFAQLFADFGVVLVDGSDPELDQIAAPLYRATLARARELNAALLGRDQELGAAGYHQQVHITSTWTPLFVFRDGARVPLHLGAAGEFELAAERSALGELEARAGSAPESFSPNVLLRPVFEDYLLPTLAYVGGAAEVAYFAQAAVLYQELLGRVTPIVPRFSATLIEPRAQALLEKYQLKFGDLFAGREALREQMAARRLPADLAHAFDQAISAVEHSLARIRERLAQLDPTLVESGEHAQSKMIYQIQNLRARAARAELRHTEVVARHAEALTNALYPEKTLQERELAGIYFLARQGRELLRQLKEVIHPDCLDHQVVRL